MKQKRKSMKLNDFTYAFIEEDSSLSVTQFHPSLNHIHIDLKLDQSSVQKLITFLEGKFEKA